MRASRRYLMIALWLTCHAAEAGPAQSVAPAPVTPAQAAESAERRRITVTRTHRGLFATGAVLLRQAPSPDAGSSLHRELAGSRAWLALAEECYGLREWECAVACAYAGLEELGREYCPRGTLDDSELALAFAKEHLQKDNNQKAATIMVRVLTTRVQLYVKLYADAIVE